MNDTELIMIAYALTTACALLLLQAQPTTAPTTAPTTSPVDLLRPLIGGEWRLDAAA